MNESIKQFLKPLASLRLTVLLLAMAMILIFAGTLAQRDTGVWQVQKQLFHNGICWIPLRNIVFINVPGSFPFIGGYTLIGLLLLNLLAAHAVRFKLVWKRSGVILIHAGLILLLLGELCTANFAREGQIELADGDSVNYTQDVRKVELAVVDTTPQDYDDVTVVPASMLQTGDTVHEARLPFDIKIDSYFVNSRMMGPFEPATGARTMTFASGTLTSGTSPMRVMERASFTGAGNQAEKVDAASASITLLTDGKPVASFVLSQWWDQPQEFSLGGKTYRVDLRFRREYKPYTVHLVHFTHDRFVGTELDKNFSSRIRLIDPSRGVDREALIWMNHPLRYRGETFYQQSFSEQPGLPATTTLQVVHNPAYWVPYTAVSIAALGMLIHFSLSLIPFLRRRFMGGPNRAARPSTARQPWLVAALMGIRSRWRIYLPAAALGCTCLVIVFLKFSDTNGEERTTFDLATFGQLPVNFEGRSMPMDTLARTALKITHGSEILTSDGKTVPPIQWLIDVMAKPEAGNKYPTFRIDNPDLLNAFGLDSSKKFFTFDELLAQRDKLQAQFDQATAARQAGTFDNADLVTKKADEQAGHVNLFMKIRNLDDLYVVPPLEAGENWQSVAEAEKVLKSTGVRRPGFASFVELMQEYAAGDVQQFNAATADYLALLQEKTPAAQTKISYESFLNHFDPFFLCLFFYVLVFLLAAGSWLCWTRPLAAAALVVLLITWGVHTFGLVSRIYISGRPPVTNLYSSAVFIAWGAVLTTLILEILYRNGIGSVVAAVMGFSSLLIAQVLSVQGDTMEQLRAVLDTNFWLWTHVPCVTIGYLATAAVGMLGATYILLGIFTPLVNVAVRKDMARMIYGVACFAILFSFVGTILGGIWADQSWGRFWGWDPKENGAILIVLSNAILLHSRWGGLVRVKGTMALGVFGNIVVSWSWFGTNMLGVGLHSYGFMEKAFPVLVGFIVSQLLIIALSFTPIRFWRSFRDEFPQPQAEAARPVNIGRTPAPAY